MGKHALIGVLFLAIAGCKTEQQLLEEQRAMAIQTREAYQNAMGAIPPRSRWSDHRDTDTLLQGFERNEKELADIDRKLGR